VERIYVEMTARPQGAWPGARSASRPGDRQRAAAGVDESAGRSDGGGGGAAPFNGTADLPKIASDLQMEIDELFPVAETLQMLRFAEVEGGDIKLMEDGLAFAHAALDERKRIFMRHLLTYVPLAAHIRGFGRTGVAFRAKKPVHRRTGGLHERGGGRSDPARGGALGRYAEAFAYDDENAMFSLENPT
jgi:NitT/TauT family transport system ATP-binding protein